MIADHVDSLCVYYPKEWGASRFQFGQIVKYKEDFAFVSGLNYVCEQSYFCQEEDFSPGWYCEITFITGEWAQFYETIGHHEDCIQSVSDAELSRFAMFIDEIQPNQYGNSLPSFVQNQIKRLGAVNV